MQSHVLQTVSRCFAVLRQLRTVRRQVSTSVFQSLIFALVLSRLDYCNSVLFGLPTNLIQCLQYVQNAAARLSFIIRRSVGCSYSYCRSCCLLNIVGFTRFCHLSFTLLKCSCSCVCESPLRQYETSVVSEYFTGILYNSLHGVQSTVSLSITRRHSCHRQPTL